MLNSSRTAAKSVMARWSTQSRIAMERRKPGVFMTTALLSRSVSLQNSTASSYESMLEQNSAGNEDGSKRSAKWFALTWLVPDAFAFAAILLLLYALGKGILHEAVFQGKGFGLSSPFNSDRNAYDTSDYPHSSFSDCGESTSPARGEEKTSDFVSRIESAFQALLALRLLRIESTLVYQHLQAIPVYLFNVSENRSLQDFCFVRAMPSGTGYEKPVLGFRFISALFASDRVPFLPHRSLGVPLYPARRRFTMEKDVSDGTSDIEKRVEVARSGSLSEDMPQADVAVGAIDKPVWLKLDLWLLPVVSMFYFLSFLDRTNLGNARVAGLQNDLNITNHQYSVALTVTYVPYILAELPSNLLLKTVGPNLMLPTMLTLWGVVTTLQAMLDYLPLASFLVSSKARPGFPMFTPVWPYQYPPAGGVFPGLVLYLSFFYPRQHLQWRISIFFSAASVSGAFSGLLAYGIIHMDGIGGKAGWSWIFIIEGLFTFAFGIAAFFLLPRTPSHARFLSQAEKEYIVEKLKEDGATGKDEEADKFSWREVWMAFKLPQVWMLSVIFFLDGTILFGLAYFTPSIVQGLGYTAARAQLMSVPPFAVAFFGESLPITRSSVIVEASVRIVAVAMLGAYISDRYRCRGFMSMFSSIMCAIGFAMFLASPQSNVQYASLFFSIPGTYLAAPTLSTWSANNAAPHARRASAIAIGLVITCSEIHCRNENPVSVLSADVRIQWDELGVPVGSESEEGAE
ncbi:hypothetical protein NMY22_g7890 [Coprinellus aureogranulatus]|nr:hypothetical protein NMY22_g7890 [Coprinellus aureogranulatus]